MLQRAMERPLNSRDEKEMTFYVWDLVQACFFYACTLFTHLDPDLLKKKKNLLVEFGREHTL